MKASVLWIDHKQLYSFFTQLTNPGPRSWIYRDFRTRSASGAEIRRRRRKRTLRALCCDGAERAEPSGNLVNSDIQPTRTFAIEELGKCGPAAVRTISTMVDDPVSLTKRPNSSRHSQMQEGTRSDRNCINVYSKTWRSGNQRRPRSRRTVESDTSVHAPLRQRYTQTYQLACRLEQSNYCLHWAQWSNS